jgi:hypothetical protein
MSLITSKQELVSKNNFMVLFLCRSMQHGNEMMSADGFFPPPSTIMMEMFCASDLCWSAVHPVLWRKYGKATVQVRVPGTYV